MSYSLPDGTTMTFTLKVSGSAAVPATSPSWSGAAVGNTAFLGIGGKPVFYQTAAGTTTMTMSNIVLTPPVGSAAISSYMLVAGDAESSNQGESLNFVTNGSGWSTLDQAGAPGGGSLYPTVSGLGTTSVTESGVTGSVGAYIFGSTAPTTVTTKMVGGGLQGVMFAVRFASIRLNLTINRARADPSDQFRFDIAATASGTSLASGTSSGTGLGPFTAASLASSSALPLTLTQTMANGSASPLGDYQSVLTCTNAVASSTVMPTNVATVSYNFGPLQFGDNVQCQFVDTPYPHLKLIKALGTGGRQYAGDQFTLRIDQGGSSVTTTTTTGTAATLASNVTANAKVTAGTTYTLYEAASGTTRLSQYSATMACTNAWTASTTALGTSTTLTITPQMGDVIVCTLTNTKRAANAELIVTKNSDVFSDPTNGASNPKMIPGAVVTYTIVVANGGPSAVDSNTVFALDTLPAEVSVGTAANPTFTDGSPTSGLTFSAATDVRYSNAVSAPTSFAGCTYTPVSAYDPAVRYVCLNPKGIMAGSTGTPPFFTLSFRAMIK